MQLMQAMAGTLKQPLSAPVLEFDEPEVSPFPPGFKILLSFHTLFGICYFGLVANPIIKFLTLATSITFIIAIVLFSLPCVLNCAFTWSQLFVWGLSHKLLVYTVIVLDVYHSVMSCITIALRSRRLRDFFERCSDYCNTFGVNLLPAQRTKLSSVAMKIVFLNLMHLVIEVCILTLVVPHKVVSMGRNEAEEGKGSKNNPVDPISRDILYPVVMGFRIMQVIYSKVIESNLIFVTEYLTMIVQRLEMRYDKFVYRSSSMRTGQSIEVGKVAFIEIQNLIKEADEVFSHAAFEPMFIDVSIVLIGVLEACDGITRRRQVASEDIHELFNAFASLISVYMCCEYRTESSVSQSGICMKNHLTRFHYDSGASGDCIESEMKEVIQSISYINAERFTEHDYKSVSPSFNFTLNTRKLLFFLH
jgi:hypothetical protein